MEKYCKSCGKVFKNSDFKICPYCGNQLSARAGRQPLPRKLRHLVFQRDGYRCRECGATNKQTRLHVDHIKPVAKGGTNDISNLQTLCEECNMAKYTDEWVGGISTSEELNNELCYLKSQLIDVKSGLLTSTNENEIIEYKYQILKLEEKIPKIEEQLNELNADVLETNKSNQILKDKLFKMLYVSLDKYTYGVLMGNFHISNKSKEDNLKQLVKSYTAKEIHDKIIEKKYVIKINYQRDNGQSKGIELFDPDNLMPYMSDYKNNLKINDNDTNTSNTIQINKKAASQVVNDTAYEITKDMLKSIFEMK